MKTVSLLSWPCLLLAGTALAQPVQRLTPADQAADGVYRPVEFGPHHRVMQRLTEVQGEDGFPTVLTNSYVELATGLHAWSEAEKKWIEASDEIEILEEGAVARKSQHHVSFAGNLNDPNGTIDLTTPDGQRLRSRVIGLAYTEADTGKSVFIVEVKDSQGVVFGRNQVLYLDAFDGLQADVRYTTTRSSFEQDVILREQLPSAAEFGLHQDSTMLEVWTEFLEAPQPATRKVDVRRSGGRSDQEEILDFHTMKMPPGQAYVLADAPQENTLSQVVTKQWQAIDGKLFLIESLPLSEAWLGVQTLPARQEADSGQRRGNGAVAAARPVQGRVRPVKLFGRAPRRPENWRRLAQATPDLKRRAEADGYVLDYIMLNTDQTNYTFKGDTTYYVSEQVNLSGTTTVEGGAVLKYAKDSVNLRLLIMGPLVCKTSPYRLAVLTAKDDDTVGEVISGSSGAPADTYAKQPFRVYYTGTAAEIAHFRIAWQYTGVHIDSDSGHVVRDCQFLKGKYGLAAMNASVAVRNVLIEDEYDSAIRADYGSVTGEHLTIHKVNRVLGNYPPASLLLTNCILAGITNATTDFTNSFGVNFGSGSGPFQTVGGGSHYLANNTYRNAGTTAINAQILADLKRKTTYPPLLLTNPITTSTTLSPQAQRDTDVPDLGYHYDPLDYLISNVALTNATVTLTNGVAVGYYGDYGFKLYGGGNLVSEGSPVALNRITRYRTVQENPMASSEPYSHTIYCDGSYSPAPQVQLRFTDMTLITSHNGSAQIWPPSSGAMNITLRDSWLRGGTLQALSSSGLAMDISNCLFERVSGYIQGGSVTFYNNTFYGGTANFYPSAGQTYTVKDNLFDQTTVSNGTAGTWNLGFNCYVTNYSRLTPSQTNDVILAAAPAYQSAALGTYYLPSGSPLIDTGSRTVSAAGLFHHTTRTDQTKDSSNVDIGFHYVALDGENPMDTDGDGVPDYFEDRNGNGSTTPDSGETKWQDASDSGLKVLITAPKSNSNVP